MSWLGDVFRRKNRAFGVHKSSIRRCQGTRRECLPRFVSAVSAFTPWMSCCLLHRWREQHAACTGNIPSIPSGPFLPSFRRFYYHRRRLAHNDGRTTNAPAAIYMHMYIIISIDTVRFCVLMRSRSRTLSSATRSLSSPSPLSLAHTQRDCNVYASYAKRPLQRC